MSDTRHPIGLIVGNYYRLEKHIGAGSFGDIFQGEDTRTGDKVAIKLESADSRSPQLELEYKIYSIFSEGINEPKVYYYGKEEKYNVLAMELLGLSLEDLFQKGPKRFSVKTVLMIVDQTLSALQYVHAKGILHRDVKPDNFIMGVDKHANQVYVIDFGLSKQYISPKTKKHIAFSDHKSLTGTARYASINTMKGYEQSRRDDLESLGYVWLYLLRGSLPWQGLPAKTSKQKYQVILDVKMQTSPEELCYGFPNEFVEYFQKVRALEFEEEPDYAYFRRIFRECFLNLGYTYDYVYDWSPDAPQFIRPQIRQAIELPRQAYTQPATPKQSPRQQEPILPPPQPLLMKPEESPLPTLIQRPENHDSGLRESTNTKNALRWKADRLVQPVAVNAPLHIKIANYPVYQSRTRLPSPKKNSSPARKKVSYRLMKPKFEAVIH